MRKIIGMFIFYLSLIVTVVGMWMMLDGAMAYARDLGRQQAAKAMIMEKSRTLPDVVLVKKAMPDAAQVCAEPPNEGIVACKTVAEFRAWVREPRVKVK